MKDKVFLDTNIFVYTQSAVEIRKRDIALNILTKYECTVSTQVFNEFSNVMLKKLKMHIDSVKQIISAIKDRCDVVIIDYKTIQKALDLKKRYYYSYYDCLMLASALESNCRMIFTEDLSDGQIIENKLRIVNVFKNKET